MQTEYVILVDEQDNETGVLEKLQAHREARLHRAISVFVFNTAGKLLIQQRAAHKYHSAGLWTNTCCSHPRPGETPADAATRRLYEEMGVKCALQPLFTFTYKAPFDNGLTEYELDHVFIGHTDAIPMPDKNEVSDWRYVSIDEIEMEMKQNPANFTAWFNLIIDRVKESATI